MKSNTEWKMWGKTDPLFAVASWENRNREGTSPWTEDEFFQLGKSDWQDFVLRWERYGIDARACAEIGCGAGRLTKPMSAYFGKMDALDVSEGMLDYARKHVTTAQFHLVDGNTIPLPDRSVTAVFSAHVFQHFDSLDDATGYFNEIHRVLVTGGTMMIHLPIYWWPLGMGKLVMWAFMLRRKLGALKVFVLRWRIRRGAIVNLMRGISYPADYLFNQLTAIGFVDVEICVFRTKSNEDAHQFLLARVK